jgi:hypothetical protein
VREECDPCRRAGMRRMLLTGRKTRAVLDRYNIVNEQELLTAGERLAAYVAKSGS